MDKSRNSKDNLSTWWSILRKKVRGRREMVSLNRTLNLQPLLENVLRWTIRSMFSKNVTLICSPAWKCLSSKKFKKKTCFKIYLKENFSWNIPIMMLLTSNNRINYRVKFKLEKIVLGFILNLKITFKMQFSVFTWNVCELFVTDLTKKVKWNRE